MIFSAVVKLGDITSVYPMVDAEDEEAAIKRIQQEFAEANGKCPGPKHITIGPCLNNPLMVKWPTLYTTTHGDYLVVPTSKLTPDQSSTLSKVFPWCQ